MAYDKIFAIITAFKIWLDEQKDNDAANPYFVALNISDLEGASNEPGSLGEVLMTYWGKYINLDLSGSALTSIGEYAFKNCTSLTSITIPNSVTSIGNMAFYVSSLTSITIPNSVTSIGNMAFCATSLANIAIPNSVTNIGNEVFSDCYSLDRITIPDSVTSIADNTFNRCTSLSGVTIPNSVTSIGESAFLYCQSLSSISIPNSVISIGNGAFHGCTSLTSVMFKGTIPAADLESDAFDGIGDLRDKFYAADHVNGTPGTYTRASGGIEWQKKPT